MLPIDIEEVSEEIKSQSIPNNLAAKLVNTVYTSTKLNL